MAKIRTDGQLWIDRNSPYGLKYYVQGETYQLVPEKIYTISPISKKIVKGSLVTADGTLAQFPRDIDKVVGICPINIPVGTSAETALIKDGEITLPVSGNDSPFVGTITVDPKLIGAPVYWFIGKTLDSNNSYSYIDPSNSDYIGKLTLETPTGMRWGTGIECDDNSLNVGYSNLPTVGTVVAVNSGVSPATITININVPKFESTLEWYWPYYSKLNVGNGYASSDTIVGNSDGSAQFIEIRHGLFPNITGQSNNDYYNFRTRCFCDAVVIGDNSDPAYTDTEHKAFVGVENYYGLSEGEPASTDKKTVIEYKSKDTTPKRLNISGKVVYGFVKQYSGNGV